jgi:hypothetical protein
MKKTYSAKYHRTQRRKRIARDSNKVRRLDYTRFSRYYTTIGGRAEHMLNNARARARKRGIACTLTHEWIKEKLDAGICEVTGVPFVFAVGNGKGHKVNSFSPSLDRINQTGDYSPENVRVTCWIYNRARGAFPDADFDKMLDALTRSPYAHRHRTIDRC